MADNAQPTPAAMSPDEKTMCLLATILAIFTGWVAPLIIWLLKKDQSPVVADCCREVLNFEITMFIASIVSFILVFVVIGVPLLLAVWIFNLVNLILGAVAINNGTTRRYPLTLRLLK